LSWIYQYQSGPVLSFGNRFFYGDLGQLAGLFDHDKAHAADIHTWFNPKITYTGTGAVPQGFVGFEGRSSQQPGTYNVRVFPSYVDALRADGLRSWDVKLLRRFAVKEALKITFSLDAMNLTNHTNFKAPNTDPTNRNFGLVTAQNGLSRVLQFNLRVEF
jgi:hypothetical protein